MKKEEKPYVFIGVGTGQRYAVERRHNAWHLVAIDSFSKDMRGVPMEMTSTGHKTLKEANAHARMVEQLFINARKGENNGA